MARRSASIRCAHEQGKRIHVFVDETRPRLQGARLTAWELQQWGIPFTLIADGAAGHFLRQGRINLVLFGADRIARNGDVANKVGSYMLATVAHENGVPVYSVAPTSTVDLSLADGDAIPIEERDPREVTEIGGVRIAPEGAHAANPAFDVTPHRYLTGIVTENGIAYPPFDVSLPRLVKPSMSESLPVVILVGGEGTRLGPQGETPPKALVASGRQAHPVARDENLCRVRSHALCLDAGLSRRLDPPVFPGL